jgi:hypothetical protein
LLDGCLRVVQLLGDLGALFGRHLAQVLERVLELALLTQVLDAQLAQRRRVAGPCQLSAECF